MFNQNRLQLGTFSANCSSGMAVTKVAERWNNNWENNLDLVKQCDEAGIVTLVTGATIRLFIC